MVPSSFYLFILSPDWTLDHLGIEPGSSGTLLSVMYEGKEHCLLWAVWSKVMGRSNTTTTYRWSVTPGHNGQKEI